MFVAIIGTRFSGKASIENYLIATKGFKSIRIVQSNSDQKFEVGNPSSIKRRSLGFTLQNQVTNSRTSFALDSSSRTDLSLPTKHLSFLSISPLLSPAQDTLCFSTSGELLKYVTENWRNNYVTVDLYTRELIEPFIRRPFFILLRCDAPLIERFNRSKRYEVLSDPFYRYSCTSSFVDVSLEDFVQEDDRIVFGSLLSPDLSKANCLQNLADLVTIHVNNSFLNLEALHRYLDTLDLLHPEHLRPSWDTYFMVRRVCLHCRSCRSHNL